MSSTLKMILPIVMLTLSAILGLVHGWGINHGHAGTVPKCEKLSVSFCRGLRYNLTAMPNFMGHEDQRQAERGVCFTILILKILSYLFSLFINILKGLENICFFFTIAFHAINMINKRG